MELTASSALPVLEETQGFMCPNPDEAFHGQSLQRSQGLEDPSHPPRHLTGGVDVVGLCVLSESLLRFRKVEVRVNILRHEK